MQRCDTAWLLYDDWCETYSRLSVAVNPQEVLKLKTLSTYLENELRSHLRTCRDCQSMMNTVVEVSDAYEKRVLAAGQSNEHVSRRPETVTVTH